MLSQSVDYFRYFPVSKELLRWGLGVTASGFTRILPRSIYPPQTHPGDHHFEWTHGRILDALQIVMISSGKGWLEIAGGKQQQVEAGTVFILHPSIWHRYRPDAEEGWEESWIELQGPVVDGLISSGAFPAMSVLKNGALEAGLDDALEMIHREARKGERTFMPELSAAAMRVMALCVRLSEMRSTLSAVQRKMMEAESYMIEHHGEELNIEELANRLGVSYSHFRRNFRIRTGFSPWQYVMRLRLAHARRLLSSGDLTLDHVGEQLGFSSGFHLSLAFKKVYGVSPANWQKAIRENSQEI